ncbi:MAG TPA: hypothetical protein VIG08_10615 [Gemmatimonadales bacterium]|jgi:hypothetical protein
MQWLETKRWRRVLATGSVLLLASGCGGHTGPTAPDDGNGGGNGGIVGAYELASTGKVALGNELQIETCIPVRFTGGGMNIYDNGAWDFTIVIETQNGNGQFRDWGQVQQAGTQLWLSSDQYGDTFEGTFDGAVAKLDYDFCPNGETDIQLVFQK